MKIKNGKNSIHKYKKNFLLVSKIKDTLSYFNKTGYFTKKDSNKSNISNANKSLFYNKSFSKTTTPLNRSKRNLSFNNINNINDSYLIETKNKTPNLLNTSYKNKFYPKSYKDKNFIREIYNRLPYLQIKNNFNSEKNEVNKNDVDNNEVKEILITEYTNSLKKFSDIYKNNGEELNNELKNKEEIDESALDFMKSNSVNSKENDYISSIIKNKKKNYSVEIENESYLSPKNSLMTLKINNQLLNNVEKSALKYQYNLYSEKINEKQLNKLKLLIMPKINIKLTKFNFENKNDISNSDKEIIQSFRKKSYFKKFNIKSIKNKKENENNKENKMTNIANEINEENNYIEKTTIDSINMRNNLLLEVKSYFCKYLKGNVAIPCSRYGATFTKYKSKLYLFGGATSYEDNDLWTLEIKLKKPIWKKINYKKESEFPINKRYGHSCVFFNNNLYIFGGNINLKSPKYSQEDILIYNIKTNTLKIGSFNKERVSLTSRSIYIPQRRNHISHVIGWNMIVHGGIDITKEYSKENQIYTPFGEEIRQNIETSITKNNESFVLNDWMMLDLITMKWSLMNNIKYKLIDKKLMKNAKLKGGVYRVYHSSCLVMSLDSIMKGNRINIYRNNNNIKFDIVDKEKDIISNAYDFEKEGKYKFDINYEGIYIFGGLDENLKETNNLFILHCFQNPLIFFEPEIKGIPPEKRSMASINFNKDLNIITLFGGRDNIKVFNDLFILDIMNFEWIKINLFGPENICKRFEHCSGILNENLFIFGGCDENNKYPQAKTFCIELDILKNKYTSKIYNYANTSLKENPKNEEGKLILKLIREGNDIPKNIFPYLKLNE